MTSTRAKAHNKRYLSGPILHRDMAPFYSAIDRLSSTSTRNHHTDGPKANHAL